MLRSMYSGISGMKVNQTKLDVVGNNISNVGTTAFKASRAKFTDMLSQNVTNAMAPSQNQGGVNASQVGLGVQLSSIDAIMTQGNLQSTGRNLDVAIDQAGFFVVSNGPAVTSDTQIEVNTAPGTHTISTNAANTNTLSYTRDGSFILDSEGNLLTGDGYRIMGYSLTNDDSTKAPTEKDPGAVSAAGLDFRFGPGSQLNGYKVVLGQVGPGTVTSASIDKTKQEIVVNGDFSTDSSLTTQQIQSAISKALSSASISQSVYVSGNPSQLSNLYTDSVAGGSDATSPDSLTIAGFTVQFSEGSSLNGYKLQIGKVDAQSLQATINTDPTVKTITIDGDFTNSGSINGTTLSDAIKNELSAKGFTQTVKNISGSPQTLAGILSTSSTTTAVAAPTFAYSNTTTNNLNGFSFGVDASNGYGANLNGYSIAFGDTTTGTLPTVSVDKTTRSIIINCDQAQIGGKIADINTKLNAAFLNNGIQAPALTMSGTTYAAGSETVKLADGVNYVKPADITFDQGGFTMSFPTATNKAIVSPLDGYTVELGKISSTAPAAVNVDTTNKKITIDGNFITPGSITATELQGKINTQLAANGITDQIKITGTQKSYTGVTSDLVTGGEELQSPGAIKALGMTFTPTAGAALNGYKVIAGTVTSGTPTTADVDTTKKTITINGDFVSGTLTKDLVMNAVTKALTLKGITSQGINVSGTPVTFSGTESNATNGGTPVQSMDADGTINFIDGTGKVSSYDGSLKSLKIPETVKIPGSDETLRVKSFTIDGSGIINAVLENGKVSAIGQIAMATFKNAEGLTKQGGNLYSTSVNSGEALIKTGVNTTGEDNSLGYGTIDQGMLEMSNVDLAEQFTEMIVATRAFQASSKAINTGDEILQNIIDLKR